MLTDADKQTTDTQTTFPTETEDGELIETIEDDDVFTETDPGPEEVEDSFYENTEEDVTQEGEEEEDLNPNLEDTAQSVQDAKETSEQLISKLNEILEKGEQTSEDIAEINSLKETYTQSYNNAKSDLEKTPYEIINEQLQMIKDSMVGATTDEILAILTDEGRKPWLYKDEENNVLVDMSSIPELIVLVNKLNLIASDGENASEIQLTPEFINLISNSNICLTGNQIKITGDTIIDGFVTANENLKILEDGSMVALNGKFSGIITGGQIRGESNFMTAPNANSTDGYGFRIYSTGAMYTNNDIQIEGENSAYVVLTKDGQAKASKLVQSPMLTTGENDLFLCIKGAEKDFSRHNLIFQSREDGYSYFRPGNNAMVHLGYSGAMFNKVYSVSGIDSSSDRTVKENIQYLDTSNNARAIQSDITEDDLYNFVKDDLIMAKFNYIGQEKEYIGFIAQDILCNSDGTDNKIGQIIVNEPNEEQSPVTISDKNYIGVLAGALRKAIHKIEELENKIEQLENKN